MNHDKIHLSCDEFLRERFCHNKHTSLPIWSAPIIFSQEYIKYIQDKTWSGIYEEICFFFFFLLLYTSLWCIFTALLFYTVRYEKFHYHVISIVTFWKKSRTMHPGKISNIILFKFKRTASQFTDKKNSSNVDNIKKFLTY